jgi:PAS domain S-box-containing protein
MPLSWSQLFTEKVPLYDYPELVDDKHIPLLRVAIWVMLVGSVIFMGLLLTLSREYQWRIYSSAGLMTIAAAAHVMLRYRGAIPTLRLLAIGSWILATLVSFIGEGVRTPILLSYPIILIFCGWLLGERFATRLFVASSVAVVALAISQQIGLISPSQPVPPAMVAIVHLIVLSVSAVMTLYLLRLFRDRYAEERRLNQELQSSLQTVKLRESELRVAATAFESQEAMLITDAQGVILRVNKAFTAITGYAAEEAVGQTPRLLKSDRHNADFYQAMWDSLLRTGGWQGEIWNRRKNGELHPAWLTLSAVKDTLGVVSHYIGAHFDISEQKQAADVIKNLNLGLEQRVMERTAELEIARDAALAADRAKSDFLASMSHEIRTPLNAVLGFSQLIGMAPDVPEETRNNAQEIVRAGQHLLVLINEVLDLARIEAKQIGLSLEPVLVNALLADCLGMIRPIADEHGIELINQTKAGDTTMVHADYVRLRQVMINLLSNAIKYNRPHGRVTLSTQTIAGSVRVSVSDSGPGIAADKQGQLFNAFDRIGKETGTVQGTGIGLVISKRLVEAMAGRIGFESIKDQGSTFWVELPVSDTEEIPSSQASAPPSVPEEGSQQRSRREVLYVEDNPASLRLMERIIAKWPDMLLRGASTAEIGIALARAKPPALILMDINLPGMNGYEALAQLRADPITAHVPVIALTANAMKGEQDRAQAAGFCAFVTKPIDLSCLYETLRKALEEPLR